MSERDAIELVSPHCDIESRLEVVPPSARIRGVYIKSVSTVLQAAGCFGEYERLFPNESWSSFKAYPLSTHLIRLAAGGAVLAGTPEKVHEGMWEIGRNNAIAVSSSLLGRTMLRLLSKDPVKLTEQGLAARRQTCLYGWWGIKARGERMLEVEYRNEYMWLESAIAGAAIGTFEVCDIDPQVETRLDDRFNGSTLIRW